MKKYFLLIIFILTISNLAIAMDLEYKKIIVAFLQEEDLSQFRENNKEQTSAAARFKLNAMTLYFTTYDFAYPQLQVQIFQHAKNLDPNINFIITKEFVLMKIGKIVEYTDKDQEIFSQICAIYFDTKK